MFFLHLTEDTQYAYSDTRQAIAEYYKKHDGSWGLMDWLWDGQLATIAEAKTKLAEYLGIAVEKL